MHILLICKVVTNPLEIKKEIQKGTKIAKVKKNYTKIKKIS